MRCYFSHPKHNQLKRSIYFQYNMQYKYLPCHFLLILFCSIVTGCTSLNSGLKNHPQNKFAIKNVNVIPMVHAGEVLPDATVIIENGVIVSINGSIPKDIKIINGKGKWLIPGLIDAHVH